MGEGAYMKVRNKICKRLIEINANVFKRLRRF